MNKKLNFIAILSTLLLFAFTMQLSAKTWYISPAGSDSNNGESWSSPLATATKAIALAENGDEIWFAGGLYEIGSGGINYNVAKSLKFYASFAGTETEVSQRTKVADGEEWEFVNPTVFKMTAGSTNIFVNNASITATFDGFTLDGDNISGTRGIVANNAVEVIITRCIVKNNNAPSSANGGAGILGTKKIAVDYCLVENNTATSTNKWGGGICILAAGSSVKNSTIKGNECKDNLGGGIGVDNVAGVVIADCVITGNKTNKAGGGISAYRIDVINNCRIEGNNAAGNGGGINLRAFSGSAAVYNCVIVGNESAGDGGGVAYHDADNVIKVYNSIIAGNKGNSGVSFAGNRAKHEMINCLLYNNTNGGGSVINVKSGGTNNVFKNNIIDNASIANLKQTACIIETDVSKLFSNYESGDFTPPAAGFAGLNKGDGTGLSFADGKDFAGNARVQEGRIEIGAYELTPASLVTLKSLKINGVEIEGFMTGLTEYNISLPSSVSTYPVITAEPTSGSAVVSAFTYYPVVFDTDAVNTVSFTVTNGGYSTAYTINIRIDIMPELSHLILTRIREDLLTRDRAELEADIDGFLPKMQADGSFSDCTYGDGADRFWPIERLREMGIAYTQPGNKYYEDEAFYAKIVKGFESWYAKNWTSTGWFAVRVHHPHRLGWAFIAMYGGKKDIREETVFKNFVERWRNTMGDPDSPQDPTTAGVNKCNIAMHWIYRALLTLNEEDLTKAIDRSFSIVDHTTGEGLQHDFSYRQHGSQLYVGGYGSDFIRLIVNQASYLVETKYELSNERLERISQFVRNTYLPAVRGKRISFSLLGRHLTGGDNRTNVSTEVAPLLNKLKKIDTAHTLEYENAIKRLTEEEAPSFGVPATQTHFYRGEYTLHQRPAYTFDIRMASNRMARSEYDINENKQGFFLSEGATGIFVNGEEYCNTMPFWDWKKIPGTTIPDLDVMRRADSYIFNGRSSYAGGVTDGRYGVTAFEMINDQELFAWNNASNSTRLPALDFGAKKSWFTFDKEIVCLGAGIYSGHDEPIFTTVNQSRQVGEVAIMSEGSRQVVSKNTTARLYNEVDWVFNDKVAYFFPEKSNLYVSNETKTASWYDISTLLSSEQVSGELFTLWFNHGVRPEKAKYAYILVPGIENAEDAKNYDASNIEILANTDSVQVVYHKELKLYGLAFFKACGFQSDNLLVEASVGCVVMIKDADKEEMRVWVADPQKQAQPIKLGIKIPKLKEVKEVVYQNPVSPHQGKSLEFTVNNDSPAFGGKDVLLDRSNWIITASSVGPTDATVAVDGDVPGYMIDGNTQSAFLFVKPGKNYGGVTVPAGVKPSFTIDMKQAHEMTYLVYRHRDIGNTSDWLRASKGSFYGKNSEEESFEAIIENFNIPTNVTEARIDFPESVSYRYVKFVIEDWDKVNGSTIQVSEFNLGNTIEINMPSSLINLKSFTADLPFSLYPNPVQAGQPFNIRLDKGFTCNALEIYSIPGAKLAEKSVKSNTAELKIDNPGIYIIAVKTDVGRFASRIIVK